ncbi:MAG: DUF2336 domain-containing protein [Alphaproteobacteria bacterium]
MTTVLLEHIKEDDVRVLLKHSDAEKRAGAGQRICRTVRAGSLSKEERAFAHKLLQVMVEDAASIVRRTLSITLKNSPELPREIAKKIIADIDNVAIPVLVNSPVLTDEDLIEVLRSKAASKIIAIAKRAKVSGTLVREIVRFGDSHAVAEVAANDGAIIDPAFAATMLDLYHDDDLIKEAFIARRDLPVRVMEKLIAMVSDEAALLINRRHNLPMDLSVELTTRARERATLDIVGDDMGERDMQLLIERLHQEGRLMPSIVIRMAGLGRMRLLKYALSALSGIRPAKAALMIHDGGPFGLKALCERAGMTLAQTKVIRAACAMFHDLEACGTEYDQTFFQSLMIERMLTLPYDLSEGDQEWFLERLDGLQQLSGAA